MERIVVTLGERSYPITIASGLFNEPASFLPLKSGEQVMLVTNETLAPLYLDKVRGVLEQAGVNVDSVILPDGEQYKSLAVLDTVFTALLQKPHGRDTTLVARRAWISTSAWLAKPVLASMPFLPCVSSTHWPLPLG